MLTDKVTTVTSPACSGATLLQCECDHFHCKTLVAITTINGATASDKTSLVGTTGKDTFTVTNELDNVFIGAQAEADTATITGAASNFDAKNGKGADTMTFNDALKSSFVNGNADNDTLTVTGATTGSSVYGGKGTDSITFSTIDSSVVNGQIGQDTITVTGAVTASKLYGGDDADTFAVTGRLSASTLQGGKGADTITAGELVNAAFLRGGADNDNITTTGAITSATVSGNKGDDTITIGNAVHANASVYGGEGRDTITSASTTALLVSGDKGNDNIDLSGSADHTVNGGAGADTLQADGGGDNIISGDGGNDTLTGGAGADTLNGGDDDDSLVGAAGNDSLSGNAGVDNIDMGGGVDTVNGGQGNDVINLGANDLTREDTVDGDTGTNRFQITEDETLVDLDFTLVDDINEIRVNAAITAIVTVAAEAAAAGIVVFDASADTGAADAFTLDASAYTVATTVTGGASNDVLTTGSGADTISGAGGADIITAGLGVDTITLGAGSDDVIATDLVTAAGVANVDVVTDFTRGADDMGFSIADIESLTGITDFVNSGNAGSVVAAAAVVQTTGAGTYDLAGTATANVLTVNGDFTTTGAVETALETGGTRALIANNAMAAADSFLIMYDNGTDSFVAMATTTAGVANNASFAAGDLTVTNLLTLQNQADATQFAAAEFLNFVA